MTVALTQLDLNGVPGSYAAPGPNALGGDGRCPPRSWRCCGSRYRGGQPHTRDAAAPRITSLTAQRAGRQTATWHVQVTIASPRSLTYYWFIDGAATGRTARPALTILRAGPFVVDVIGSPHRDLDMTRWQRVPRAPRRLLQWVRPTTPVDHYLLQWATGETPGEWTTFATVRDDGRWLYEITTPELEDLTWYHFRAVPVYEGNEGTPRTWAGEHVVRIPPGPAFEAQYEPVTQKVTLASA
jgi:hypothetical protein